ncbi:methyl-accepting chemotaxis sensory transducer [Rhodopseudomonas palustris HaA2]|uniref:Methyl-accepting chemotaxis sensory transducer n=1 Tax=Rhodopseudomonas palustris (strain HaA2) TaxID=316058 RepID=Q2IXV5_RHOP2|nr:methyl-accepting chemotaxis protein [Rhodopseudomonas palustris]ABD06955.1 methyl-accepting chemotaxis sensory transducer [Rhodopseudomonas palustris HaA2]
MLKLNRIGNKLGIAGLIGISLAIGMVVNQSITESKVKEATRIADVEAQVSEKALIAESEMRNMQLAVRGVRLSRSLKELDQRTSQFNEARDSQVKLLDAAISLAILPGDKDMFTELKKMNIEYAAGAGEQAEQHRRGLDLNLKRASLATEWDKKVAALKPVLGPGAALGNLREADGDFAAIRSIGWKYFVVDEKDYKAKMDGKISESAESLKRAAEQATDAGSKAALRDLEGLLATYAKTTSEAFAADTLKNSISRDRTVPIANKAAKMLRGAVEKSQQSVAEAKARTAAEIGWSGRLNLAFGAAIILVLIGSALFSFLGVARPLTRLNGALGEIAAGRLDVKIVGAERGDEIGDIGKTVGVIQANAEQKARDEVAAKAELDRELAQKRKQDMIRLADEFEGAIGEIVDTVSAASEELEASATSLTTTAERSQSLATTVASASEEASTNVQSVASATEEMSSSVNEISRQVQESARIAQEAVDQARLTNDRVEELAQAAARIGDVVELINTIAGQTNLLALNATIEAARAGEAGRGFAVVASEVKALAEQTAKATGEISQQINGIQSATEQSVAAIKEIGGTIGRMSEISSTIASAVEEQGAATQEISRNVQQAAYGTQQVSANITDVQRGATETGAASSQVLHAAQSLSGDSNRLKLEVERFLGTVRAA